MVIEPSSEHVPDKPATRDSNPVGSVFMVITAIIAFASLAISWWVFERTGLSYTPPSIKVNVYATGVIMKQWCDPSCRPDSSLLIESTGWGGGVPNGGNQTIWIVLGGLLCLGSAGKPRFGFLGVLVLLIAPISFCSTMTIGLKGFSMTGAYNPSGWLTDTWHFDTGFSMIIAAIVLGSLTSLISLFMRLAGNPRVEPGTSETKTGILNCKWCGRPLPARVPKNCPICGGPTRW